MTLWARQTGQDGDKFYRKLSERGRIEAENEERSARWTLPKSGRCWGWLGEGQISKIPPRIYCLWHTQRCFCYEKLHTPKASWGELRCPLSQLVQGQPDRGAFSPWGKCFCDSPQNLFHRLSIAYTTMFSVQKKLHLKGVLRRTTLLLFTSGTETEMLFHPGESCFAIPPGFTLGDIHCCSLRSRPNTWYGSACWQFLTGWVRNWQFRTEVGGWFEIWRGKQDFPIT